MGSGAFRKAHRELAEGNANRGEAAWLARPLAWPRAPEQWRAVWSELKWRDNTGATPYTERPTRVLLVDGNVESGADTPLQRAVLGPDGMTFALHGEAGKPRRMSWTGRLPQAIATALRLDDSECFSLELTYDRGASETAFPYSLADRACYLPVGELGAYAVAVDPARRLQKITLHARQFGLNSALAGLTLNTSQKALVPELATFPAPERSTRRPDSIAFRPHR